MNYDVIGPFPIPRDEWGNISRSLTDFWKEIDEGHPGLSNAKGCYVFGVKTSGGPRITPWYVGKTSAQGFAKECFAHHKRTHYAEALSRGERRAPVLFLLPRLNESGGLYRGAAGINIKLVETYLISWALTMNPNLLNTHATRFWRETHIPGLLNSNGKIADGAGALAATLGMK